MMKQRARNVSEQSRRSLGKAKSEAMIPVPAPRSEAWPVRAIVQEALAQISWHHKVTQLEKLATRREHKIELALVDHPDDKPTIGLLLCQGKDRLVVEYALRGLRQPLGVADWETQVIDHLPDELRGTLPTVEEIEAELRSPEQAKQPAGKKRTHKQIPKTKTAKKRKGKND